MLCVALAAAAAGKLLQHWPMHRFNSKHTAPASAAARAWLEPAPNCCCCYYLSKQLRLRFCVTHRRAPCATLRMAVVMAQPNSSGTSRWPMPCATKNCALSSSPPPAPPSRWSVINVAMNPGLAASAAAWTACAGRLKWHTQSLATTHMVKWMDVVCSAGARKAGLSI